MKIEGEAAKGYTAVRLDSCESIEGNGKIFTADEETGSVHWNDATGQPKSLTLGPHAIRILPRASYGR